MASLLPLGIGHGGGDLGAGLLDGPLGLRRGLLTLLGLGPTSARRPSRRPSRPSRWPTRPAWADSRFSGTLLKLLGDLLLFLGRLGRDPSRPSCDAFCWSSWAFLQVLVRGLQVVDQLLASSSSVRLAGSAGSLFCGLAGPPPGSFDDLLLLGDGLAAASARTGRSGPPGPPARPSPAATSPRASPGAIRSDLAISLRISACSVDQLLHLRRVRAWPARSPCVTSSCFSIGLADLARPGRWLSFSAIFWACCIWTSRACRPSITAFWLVEASVNWAACELPLGRDQLLVDPVLVEHLQALGGLDAERAGPLAHLGQGHLELLVRRLRRRAGLPAWSGSAPDDVRRAARAAPSVAPRTLVCSAMSCCTWATISAIFSRRKQGLPLDQQPHHDLAALLAGLGEHLLPLRLAGLVSTLANMAITCGHLGGDHLVQVLPHGLDLAVPRVLAQPVLAQAAGAAGRARPRPTCWAMMRTCCWIGLLLPGPFRGKGLRMRLTRRPPGPAQPPTTLETVHDHSPDLFAPGAASLGRRRSRGNPSRFLVSFSPLTRTPNSFSRTLRS